MKKAKYLMASIDISNELITCGEYRVISVTTNDEAINYYTVVNELGEEKEYVEDFFDLECK